jgi:hypothetical protein
VREGVVNTYAMNFVVPVPAHISDLEFSWQSLTKNPVCTLHDAHTAHRIKLNVHVSYSTDNRCACQINKQYSMCMLAIQQTIDVHVRSMNNIRGAC